jgi:hypothetical protein
LAGLVDKGGVLMKIEQTKHQIKCPSDELDQYRFGESFKMEKYYIINIDWREKLKDNFSFLESKGYKDFLYNRYGKYLEAKERNFVQYGNDTKNLTRRFKDFECGKINVTTYTQDGLMAPDDFVCCGGGMGMISIEDEELAKQISHVDIVEMFQNTLGKE